MTEALSEQTEADEAYEIGKRDGYESAVQDIDLMTGGDGEYYVSTLPGRGCPDAETMKARIAERFATRSEGHAPERPAGLTLTFADLEDLHSAVAQVITANERAVLDEEARWERLGVWLTRLAVAGNERFPANWKGLPEGHAPERPMGEDGAGFLLALMAACAEGTAFERDDALDRIEELEKNADIVSAEFEGDCWKAVRSLLERVGWTDFSEGITAEAACEIIGDAIHGSKADQIIALTAPGGGGETP